MSSIDIARMDTVHCLMPGLFKNIAHTKSKQRMELDYHYGKDLTVKAVGPYQLGAYEMRVLQSITYLSTQRGMHFDVHSATSQTALSLKTNLEIQTNRESCVIQTSYYEICKYMGVKPSGRQYELIELAILKLYSLTMYFVNKKTKTKEMSRLLVKAQIQEEQEKGVSIALNPQLAQAALGFSSYTKLNINDAIKLKTDISRLLFQRLNAILPETKEKAFKLTTLKDYVWFEMETTPANERQRNLKIKKGLSELSDKLGWHVCSNSKDIFLISRKMVINSY